MKTLILGLGNPILGDDGVGIYIASALDGLFQDTEVYTASMIDLNMLDLFIEYDRVIVIDALLDGSSPIGTLRKLPLGQATLHLFSSHGVHFFELLQLGKDLRYDLPRIERIYGIGIGDGAVFGTELSPRLMEMIEDIIHEIIRDLRKCFSVSCKGFEDFRDCL